MGRPSAAAWGVETRSCGAPWARSSCEVRVGRGRRGRRCDWLGWWMVEVMVCGRAWKQIQCNLALELFFVALWFAYVETCG